MCSRNKVYKSSPKKCVLNLCVLFLFPFLSIFIANCDTGGRGILANSPFKLHSLGSSSRSAENGGLRSLVVIAANLPRLLVDVNNWPKRKIWWAHYSLDDVFIGWTTRIASWASHLFNDVFICLSLRSSSEA